MSSLNLRFGGGMVKKPTKDQRTRYMGASLVGRTSKGVRTTQVVTPCSGLFVSRHGLITNTQKVKNEVRKNLAKDIERKRKSRV